MKMLLNGEGVKAVPLASGTALTPSPFAAGWAAASSFLSLGRCPALSQNRIPQDGQACINLFPQAQRVRLLIESLQPLLLLLTQDASRQQTLIGCLGLIPFAPHFVAFYDFFPQMHHRLEQVVVEPHPLIEGVACCHLLSGIQSQLAEVLPHQGVVFLLHMTVIILLIRPAA